MGGKTLSPMVTAGIIAAVVLIVGIVGYVMWSYSGPPEPTIPADQTLQNPFGKNPPPQARGPATANPQMPNVATPGTVDPRGGSGPSPVGAAQRP